MVSSVGEASSDWDLPPEKPDSTPNQALTIYLAALACMGCAIGGAAPYRRRAIVPVAPDPNFPSLAEIMAGLEAPPAVEPPPAAESQTHGPAQEDQPDTHPSPDDSAGSDSDSEGGAKEPPPLRRLPTLSERRLLGADRPAPTSPEAAPAARIEPSQQPPASPRPAARPAPPPNPWNDLPRTQPSETAIREVITLTATKGLISLGVAKADGTIGKIDARICDASGNPIHSLKVMSYIVMQPDLKAHMKTIADSTLKWKGFVSDITERLAARNREKPLHHYLPGFATEVGATTQELYPYFFQSNWGGLLLFLINRR